MRTPVKWVWTPDLRRSPARRQTAAADDVDVGRGCGALFLGQRAAGGWQGRDVVKGVRYGVSVMSAKKRKEIPGLGSLFKYSKCM